MEKYPLDELKLIYRLLHRNLTQNTALLDSILFTEMQTYLHRQAQDKGVDIGDHGAWDEWLGNEVVSCAVRMEKRASMN